MDKRMLIVVLVIFCVCGSLSSAALGAGGYYIYSRSSITGRFVKLNLPAKGCLNIAEIEVYSGGVNVAKDKSVTQSSMYDAAKFPSSFLVDGDRTNFAHTSCEDIGWMMIDLGADTTIEKIVVYNRTDCCNGRTIGAKLSILDASNSAVWTSDGFKGKADQTDPVESMDGWPVYTVTPPATIVVGSNI